MSEDNENKEVKEENVEETIEAKQQETVEESAENKETTEERSIENDKSSEDSKTKDSKTNKNGLIVGIIAGIVVIALIIGAFIAYKNGNLNVPGLGNDISNISGMYNLIEMSQADKTYSEEEIDALKTLGLTVTLELKEDKTGVLKLYGEEMNLTYDRNNMTINEGSAPYTFDGSTIKMEQNGNKLVFKKATGE